MFETNFIQKFSAGLPGRWQAMHWLAPIVLVLLMISILIWLPWQAQRLETNERQEQLIADTLWVEQAIRFQLARDAENVHLIGSEIGSGYLTGQRLRDRLATLVRTNHEIKRIVWFDADGKVEASSDNLPVAFTDLSEESRAASKNARQTASARYSKPAPARGQKSPILMDYHEPLMVNDRYSGSLVVSYLVSNILEEMVPWWFAQDNEIRLMDGEDKLVVMRSAGGPGRGVYVHSRTLDLPGSTLTLHTNSVKSAPKLLPNLLVGTVIVLSIGLIWSLWALSRDINRRLAAEGALRQQMSFRTAMENSLLTGLRARDLDGRVTYVNPAFCQMVGTPAEDLVGKLPPMPYWAPEAMEEYQARFSTVLAGTVTPQFETIFQRSDGTRFPVLIFESPLVDSSGKQTGWMGSILDITDRKQVEDLNRRQHEKLQASARLATMGELASTLAHELNQPLAAISSYTTGALNLLNDEATRPGSFDPELIRPALEKAGIQAQRAGQIIRSVHAFVRKRAPVRDAIQIRQLVDNVMPLVELQARRFFVAVQTSIDPDLPAVLADCVMLEQVLLNLTRNAIESMENVAPERRVLRIEATLDTANETPGVMVSVIDHGLGIPAELADRLFSPFFSTKAEGMGMGLNICRTAIEFHGGTLKHADNPGGGTIFRFSLPVTTA